MHVEEVDGPAIILGRISSRKNKRKNARTVSGRVGTFRRVDKVSREGKAAIVVAGSVGSQV